MSTTEVFEIVGNTSNAVIAKRPGRHFPGILIQGDTLRSILDDLEELQADALAGDVEGVQASAEILRERFIEYLSDYEDALEKHGMELPYPSRVTDRGAR